MRADLVVRRAAPTDANVLILGENGTGKELVARELHRRLARAEAVFLSVDLGAVAETLFESELFGHRKGAFTDATRQPHRPLPGGDGGTLFLDEIGNLAPPLQPKLLTALEQRAGRARSAPTSPVPIDVRVISATNCPRTELRDEAASARTSCSG